MDEDEWERALAERPLVIECPVVIEVVGAALAPEAREALLTAVMTELRGAIGRA